MTIARSDGLRLAKIASSVAAAMDGSVAMIKKSNPTSMSLLAIEDY